MFKILALSTIAYVGSAFPHFRKAHKEVKQAAWPEVDLYDNFQADIALEQWDGKTLKAYKDATGTAKVSSKLNKVRVDAKVKVPLIGHADATVVVDLNVDAPAVYEHVPMLKLCQKTDLPKDGVLLEDILHKIYSETGGITVYDGQSPAPWDATVLDKFHASYSSPSASVQITAYLDKDTHNVKWI